MGTESFGESPPFGEKSLALWDEWLRRRETSSAPGPSPYPTPVRSSPHRVQSGFSQMSSVSPAQQMEQ